MMAGEFETDILRAVSRSFYLSLRLLPKPMRRAAGIGYLLARASDTIADAEGLGKEERLELLENFGELVRGGAGDVSRLVGCWIGDAGEEVLLRRCGEVLGALEGLPRGERDLVREVLEVILSGQRRDLEVFGDEENGKVVCLVDEDALDDYAYRVAGCVGVFWTKLGYETMGDRFSKAPVDEMLVMGVEYGKGLQLVNILRDLREDLARGRCYLPVEDVGDEDGLMREFEEVRKRAVVLVGKGFRYSERLGVKRLRVASVLPAMIGRETLVMLDGISFSGLEGRVKVRRSRVYRMIVEAWLRA